jgi:MoaA/NifB/PqqE/SkfB family radical SAM enzyme
MTMLDTRSLSEYNQLRQTKNKDVFCHAPFTSINFEPNGSASVCCYSRRHVLGSYPADSIDDIWFGKKAEQLRSFMRRNALPGACDICLDQFTSRNFGGLRARLFDHLASQQYPDVNGRFELYPRIMEFETSNICNLECTMCKGYYSSAIRKNREHLPPLENPYDDDFVRQLEQYIPHLTEAHFLGGEPFLIENYYRIWDRIVRSNPELAVTIVTNGTILNEKVKRAIEPLNATINISIDALDPANYERIRVNARFDRLMENFRFFRGYVERKRTSMTINVCPMQQNWRELPRFLEFCNDHGIGLFFNTLYYPEAQALSYLGPDELDEIITYLREAPTAAETPMERRNQANYLDMIQQIGSFRDKAIPRSYDDFAEGDLGSAEWSLRAAEGNKADIASRSPDSNWIRVVIRRADKKAPWDIQLNKSPLRVQANHHYVVLFRARASKPRELCYGIVEADARWERLGRYKTVPLSSEWREFQLRFGPILQDGIARLHFDLGGDDAAVELADVSLRYRPVSDGG